MSRHPYHGSGERSLAGQAFVFFGGSTGIGRATALEVAYRGGDILIVGRNRQAGEAAVAEMLKSRATGAAFLQADISTVAGIAKAAEAIRAWRPELAGVVHSAMSGFRRREVTEDGFERGFALQYFARAALNRLLADQLAASGDGRIVHIAGGIPRLLKPNLADPQMVRGWGFMKSLLNSQVLGYLHAQEAARLWKGLPITATLATVGPTRTKVMSDPAMPWLMRLIGRFGARPDISAVNAVRVLTKLDSRDVNGAILREPKTFRPEPLMRVDADARRLWQMTTDLAGERGLILPERPAQPVFSSALPVHAMAGR